MHVHSDPKIIVWFRQDLRIGDNPALRAAAASGLPVLPVFVLDDDDAGDWAVGGASRWWLQRSLTQLDRKLGGRLRCFAGRADRLIPALASEVGAVAVHVNACVEPWRVQCDTRIARRLAARGIGWHVHDGSSLFDPAAVRKADGTAYRVFSSFWRKGCLAAGTPPREPLPAPRGLRLLAADSGSRVDALDLMPDRDWTRRIEASWSVGEAAASDRLERFLATGLPGYRDGRNRPDLAHVSRLSPHLHFGEISPQQVWHAVVPFAGDSAIAADAECFLSELGWREFSRYLLWHCPEMPERNLQPKFDRFPWQSDAGTLERWQRAKTGFPIIDAGMRELWQTGYMHNRVRMLVGSLLVKNLGQHWLHGARWFWDTLVDADLANNSASWQWVAGSGVDAAPYFRIFNPVTQARRFDPAGRYVRQFLPELAAVGNQHVHEPWRAPQPVRAAIDYPEPIVDLGASRTSALAAFRALGAVRRS